MKRILVGVTLVLLALTVWLAGASLMQRRALREDARAALPEAVAALEEHVLASLSDAATRAEAWTPGERTPDGLAHVDVSASGPPPGAIAVADSGLFVVFHGGLTDVYSENRRATVSPELLFARVRADPRLGPPLAAAAGPTDEGGTWSQLRLVASEDGATLLALGAGAADGSDAGGGGLAALIGGGDDSLARGEIERERAGSGVSYKGDSGRVIGEWRPFEGLEGVWTLAEIDDAAAVRAARGAPLAAFGHTFGELHWWHLTLALAVLAMVLALFFVIQTRGVRYGVVVRIFRFVAPYKWGAVAVIALGVFYTAANFAVKVLLVKKLVDDVLVNPGPDAIQTLWFIAAGVAVMAFLIAGSSFLKEYLHNFYATAIMADLRVAIGRKIVSLPLSFFQRFRAGDLVARIERDASATRKIFNLAFKTAATTPFELVAAVVTAFIVNARLALVLLGLPLIVLPLFRIAKRIKKRSEKRQILLADISHVIFQMLVGIKVVKAFGGEEREAQRLDSANRAFIHEARRVHRLSAFSESLLDLLQLLGAAIVFVGGGYLVLGGSVSVGDIFAFVAIVQRAYTAAKKLTNTANQIVNAVPGTERVFEILDAENTLPDGPQTMRSGPLREGIRFENVSFAYGERAVVENVDLQIKAGQVVALVGPTGAGKTTLCDLVARFYDPTSGRVTYDGVDVRDVTTASLLDNVAIVTQDAFLFNAPIAENIRYGKPDATNDEVRDAARDAFVHDEIERMEGGYRKAAGERGSSVSGGQRQRITIARALLKDAPVLILDEATSALDSHAEKQVQAALDKLMSGRTVIVVAHRLSTIRNADHVVVLREGRVVEQGAPDDLLARENGVFRAMYELQMGGDGGDADDEPGDSDAPVA